MVKRTPNTAGNPASTSLPLCKVCQGKLVATYAGEAYTEYHCRTLLSENKSEQYKGPSGLRKFVDHYKKSSLNIKNS